MKNYLLTINMAINLELSYNYYGNKITNYHNNHFINLNYS